MRADPIFPQPMNPIFIPPKVEPAPRRASGKSPRSDGPREFAVFSFG